MSGLASGYLHRNDATGVYPESWYAVTASGVVERPAWTGEGRADVCIVGAGYTGLSAALHLAERGYDVVVLEAHRAGWGASGRNGGQLGSGQRVEQPELEARFGVGAAQRLWELGESAKTLARDLIGRHHIDCDLRPGILHAAHRPRYVADHERYARHMREHYGYQAMRFVPRDEVREMVGSPGYHAGVLDTDAAHLHPLDYALGLARAAEAAGARVFERSEVVSVDAAADRPVVHLRDGRLTCDHLLLACNGYLENLSPAIAARVMPINNYIIATAPLGEERARSLIRDDVAVCDSRFVVNYFRLSADRRLLFGGGESYGARFPSDIRAFVRRPMLLVFPQLADVPIDYGWGGTLAITMDRLPCFRRIGPNALSASGYSGHGVAMATLAGQVLAEATAGQAERFDLFAALPSTRFPGGTLLRWPILVLAMAWYSLRDRL